MGSQEINLVHMISNAGLMVQFVLLLLLFFSVTSWAIILIKYKYIRRAFKESTFFTEFFWRSRDLSDAFTKAKQLEGSPVARIFRIGYVELKKMTPPPAATPGRPHRPIQFPSRRKPWGPTPSSGRCAGPPTPKPPA